MDYVAEFWLGNITTRFLMALISGLPDDTALSRAQEGGKPWYLRDMVQWEILHQLVINNVYWAAKLSGKKQDEVKWPKDPWEDVGKAASTTHGRVEKGDEEAALAYLMSLSGIALPGAKED